MGQEWGVRVVLDTNAPVSALLFTGISSELVPLWQTGRMTVLLSRSILEEHLRVSSYPKFQPSEAEIEGLIDEELLPLYLRSDRLPSRHLGQRQHRRNSP